MQKSRKVWIFVGALVGSELLIISGVFLFRFYKPLRAVEPIGTSLQTDFSTSGSADHSLPQSYDLTLEQKRRVEQLTSLFENDKIELQYAYVENLKDGRGYTSGRAGFTTADGDALEVILAYTKVKPNNTLAQFIPILKKLAKEGDDSVNGLDGYSKAWKEEAKNLAFRDAQDQVVDKLYYQPSKKYADKLGFRFAVSRGFLYDTIIQHGDGDDGDGLSSLIAKTTTKMKGSPASGVDEVRWLYAFIEVRRADLKNPQNKETEDEWSQSTGRCDVYKQILDDKNYTLAGPINVKTRDYKVSIP